jgi:hypothetical protein
MKATVTIQGEGTRSTAATFEGEGSVFVVDLEGLTGGVDSVWTNGQKAEFKCSATDSRLSLELDGDAFIIVLHRGRRDYYLADDATWKEPTHIGGGHRIKPGALRIPVQMLTDPPE